MVFPSSRTPYQQLIWELHCLSLLSLFESQLIEQRTHGVISRLEAIYDPDKFELFMTTKHSKFQDIANALSAAQPKNSSDQLKEEDILTMLANLTQLINDYCAKYEPLATFIKRFFGPPKPQTFK